MRGTLTTLLSSLLSSLSIFMQLHEYTGEIGGYENFFPGARIVPKQEIVDIHQHVAILRVLLSSFFPTPPSVEVV